MKSSTALLTLALVLAAVPAWGASVTYSFSNGNRAASAEFVKSGSDLIVTLTNTSTADAMVPTDILTAVFFNIPADPLLVRTSAVVVPGSVLVGGTGLPATSLVPAIAAALASGNVGGEWAYLNNLFVDSNNQSVSSVGLNIFGPGDLFPGPDLQLPTSPDGLQLGITSAGDDLLTGNGHLLGPWLIKNSTVFTLSGFSGEPDAQIISASFQYGTGLDEPRFEGYVPEPSSFVLAVFSLIGFAVLGWRRKR
jgi:hypothetical protein